MAQTGSSVFAEKLSALFFLYSMPPLSPLSSSAHVKAALGKYMILSGYGPCKKYFLNPVFLILRANRGESMTKLKGQISI